MMDPRRLDQLDLAEPQTLKEVTDAVAEVIDFDLHREAFELLKGLEQKLRFISPAEIGPSAFEFEQLVVKLRLVAFPNLSEKDAVDLIREHVVDFYDAGVPLEDKIKQRTILLILDDRDELKKKIRDAMIKNTQLLTKGSLQIGQENNVPPSVGNWIRDYTYNVGSDIVLPAKLSNYFSQGKNILTLSQADRLRVVSFLKIYERLKFPSDVVEGLDAPMTMNIDGVTYVAIDGQVIQLKNTGLNAPTVFTKRGTLPVVREKKPAALVTESDVQEILRNLFAKHQVEDEQRFTEEEELLGRVDTDMTQILDVISSALVISDNEKVITAISVLARSGAISQAIQSKSIRDVFVDEFLGPLAEADKVPLATATGYLMAHSEDAKYAAALTQWALTRSLHGDESESARIGNRLENTLTALGQNEFTGMTYFDVVSGSFRWTPVRIQADGSLEWIE